MGNDVKMTATHDQILTIIKEHRGRGNAISYKEIARLVDRHPRTVREAVAELVFQFGQPIGTNYDHDAGGYYLITAAYELDETYEKLRGHGIRILKRAADLKGISYAEMLGQIKIAT